MTDSETSSRPEIEEPQNEFVRAMFAPDTEPFYANIFGVTSLGDEVVLGFGQMNPFTELRFQKRIYMTKNTARQMRDVLDRYIGSDSE